MSDELLVLRHKRALELLQEPGQKEYSEERVKKSLNITALKKWEEAGEPFEEDDEILGIYNHFRTLTKSQEFETLSVELLAYLEYKENEIRKNGTNSESVGAVIRTKSAGKSII